MKRRTTRRDAVLLSPKDFELALLEFIELLPISSLQSADNKSIECKFRIFIYNGITEYLRSLGLIFIKGFDVLQKEIEKSQHL